VLKGLFIPLNIPHYSIKMAIPRNMTITSFFSIRKMPPAVYPLMAVVGVAVGGASYFALYNLRGPDIRINKTIEPAYLRVGENQTSKFWNPNGKFDSYWKR
jgi:hypothetical protein